MFRTFKSESINSGGMKLLEENDGRGLLKIVNTGTNAAQISTDGNPATGGIVSWPLAGGAAWEPQNVPANPVWANSASGTTLIFGED